MFDFDLLDINESLEIVKKGEKVIYNTDKRIDASKWVKKGLGVNTILYPPTTDGLKIKQANVRCDKLTDNGLGYFHNNANNTQYNPNYVGLYTMPFGSSNGFSIVPENLLNVTCLFTARKSIDPSWVNQKDEYLAPNEEHEQFEQFKYDSLIYSLFNNSSNQTSLRQVEYKDKLWDIKNEFFWMSADRMKQLADENGYDNLYNDARTSSDRHVYNLLFGEERIYNKLSDDAKAVLDKATELVEQSMTLRQVMADDYNHLDSWDAGYAQLKLVWKEYFEEDFKEFRQLYKNLEDRMRPLVYELGFLMK